MIKNILLITVCLFAASCTSKQQKAQKLVKNYLHGQLKYAASYEAVSFGGIDTLFKRYSETKQWDSLMAANAIAKQKLDRITDTLITLLGTSHEAYMDALKRQLQYEADTSNLSKTIRSNELFFHGAIKGWAISHVYRAKNDKGVMVWHSAQFLLDSSLTKVVREADFVSNERPKIDIM